MYQYLAHKIASRRQAVLTNAQHAKSFRETKNACAIGDHDK
jgi:hypothetical protein